MKECAIIGPTASGKSGLALHLATRYNAYILSQDSLSIYKKIDIASAKPGREELDSVRHFGIDVLNPDESFNAGLFIRLYQEASTQAKQDGKNLIIVGGTGFYLKVLIQGLSDKEEIDPEADRKAKNKMHDIESAYRELTSADPEYASTITCHDVFRIQKAFALYYQTGMTPSAYFIANPKIPVNPNLRIFEIACDKDTLRDRITSRTEKMFKSGLIDEVAMLEKTYGRSPQSMKAIGIKEVLDYFDRTFSRQQCEEKIVIHTARLAKRQRTFNRTQFHAISSAPVDRLLPHLQNFFENT